MPNSNFNTDAYAPEQMAAKVEAASINKINRDHLSTFVLALLAGAFIALGAAFYTFVIHDSSLSFGLTRLLGGLVFCLGLILVVVAGAELFTGNNLIIMALVSRRIALRQLLLNWSIVFTGNLLGALGVVLLVYFSGHWFDRSAAVGIAALTIAGHKVNLGFAQAITLGILCNILVCLAVWLCYSARSVTDKVLAILFPITAFVTLGFEHSVANMYLIPAGLALKHSPDMAVHVENLAASGQDLSSLTLSGFLLNNLLPVTLGNIIGGGLFVGLVYWFIYLRQSNDSNRAS